MPFGTTFGPLWHTFSILFRHRFSDAFLGAKNLEKIATWMILVGFWTKSYKPEGIRNVTFCDFFWSPVSASIFESFWVGSGFIFDGFGMLIRPFFHIILDFAIILWHNFPRAILIQFAIFLNLFSDMSDHKFYGILFTWSPS